MKILLAHKFHYLRGGAEVFYFEVSRVLKKHGHQVAYFTTASQENIETDDRVFTVPGPDYTSGGIINKLRNSADIFYSVSNKVAFQAAIDEFNPDIIHAFAIHVHLTPAVLEAAKESGVPVVMSCNDYKHICPNYKLYDGKQICEACLGGKFYRAVMKRCCQDSIVLSVASAIEAYIHENKQVYSRLVDRYLFASEFMLNKTQTFWMGRDVQYGVLKNPFDVSAYTSRFGGDYALYFGRIIGEKGVDKIIDAAEQSHIPIKIVGDGPDYTSLLARVKSGGLTHVEFLGPRWGRELDQILYGARFVIVPSLWHENFPYVIFQSFAAGKPVLGTVRGGIPELIGRDKGLLFDPDTRGDLAGKMAQLWDNPDECVVMGETAHRYIRESFSDDVFYTSLMSNYQAVLA